VTHGRCCACFCSRLCASFLPLRIVIDVDDTFDRYGGLFAWFTLSFFLSDRPVFFFSPRDCCALPSTRYAPSCADSRPHPRSGRFLFSDLSLRLPVSFPPGLDWVFLRAPYRGLLRKPCDASHSRRAQGSGPLLGSGAGSFLARVESAPRSNDYSSNHWGGLFLLQADLWPLSVRRKTISFETISPQTRHLSPNQFRLFLPMRRALPTFAS